jgi:hypothetical protein
MQCPADHRTRMRSCSGSPLVLSQRSCGSDHCGRRPGRGSSSAHGRSCDPSFSSASYDLVKLPPGWTWTSGPRISKAAEGMGWGEQRNGPPFMAPVAVVLVPEYSAPAPVALIPVPETWLEGGSDHPRRLPFFVLLMVFRSSQPRYALRCRSASDCSRSLRALFRIERAAAA